MTTLLELLSNDAVMSAIAVIAGWLLARWTHKPIAAPVAPVAPDVADVAPTVLAEPRQHLHTPCSGDREYVRFHYKDGRAVRVKKYPIAEILPVMEHEGFRFKATGERTEDGFIYREVGIVNGG